ncbi:MAG TPA: ferredoxin [Firmicutes bacterium]|nr:ferredoxin [Bacillota bacterium]
MAKKVRVTKDVCISCGLCTTIAPEVFHFGDDGKAESSFEDCVPEDLEASAEEAASSCPVEAIEVTE